MKKLLFLIAGVCCFVLPAAGIAGEVKLALFPFETNAQEDLSNVQAGICSMLPGRLSMPGQIVVIEPAAQSAKRGMTADERLAIAKKAGADYLLSGAITKLGAVISIDARLVSVSGAADPLPISVQSSGMDGIIPQLNTLAQTARNAIIEKTAPTRPAAGPAIAAEPYPQPGKKNAYAADEPQELYRPAPRRPQSPPSRFETDKPKRSYGPEPAALFEPETSFTAAVSGKQMNYLCAGDVNGDGKRELVAAGLDFAGIYQLTGGSLALLAEIPLGIDEHVVHVDAGDFNGNGIDEIYVTCWDAQNARSFVVEYQKDRLVRIAERQRWFYRAYPLSDGSVKLIGQEAGTVNPFSGDIYLMQWNAGKLVSREQFILPGSRDLYGFGEGDIDADGVTDFLVFDRHFFNIQPDLIMVSTTAKTVWRDTKKLGGTPNFYTKYTTVTSDMEMKEFIPLRIICADIGPDGRWAAIIGKNFKKGDSVIDKLMDFSMGQVQCLLWDGSDLAPNWVSPTVSDVVRDYIIDDLDKSGVPQLIILSTRAQGLMGSCVNKFMAFRVKKK